MTQVKTSYVAATWFTEERMLRSIQRALEIGDTLMAEVWTSGSRGRRLDGCGDEFHAQMAAARTKLRQMLEHERTHGQFSLLDRSAPEIVTHERICKLTGKPSLYAQPSPLCDGTEAAICREISSKASV